MSEKQKGRRPLMLMKNVVYSTYQLHAFSSNKQTPSEDALKIIILEIMSWLRERFRALDVPTEIKLPEPNEYGKLSLDEIQSFRIDSGYILEVIFLKEEKTWAMQLVEPDLGPSPGRASQMRPPAPGRMFFTNIGLVMRENTVEIGINIQVSELEGEEIPCEVFRVGVVKRLVRNPKIGLEQEHKYRIVEEPYVVETLSDVGKLKNLIQAEDRYFPVMVISEPGENAILFNKSPGILAQSPGILAQSPDNLSHIKHSDLEMISKLSLCGVRGDSPIKAEDMAEPMMGYAYTFKLPYSFYDDFIANWDFALEDGGICVYYPSIFGGHREKYSYSELCEKTDMLAKTLESNVQEFLKKKTIGFGEVKFLRQLKQKEIENKLTAVEEQGEIKAVFLREMEDYKRLRDQKLAEARGLCEQEIGALEKDKNKLIKRIDELEERLPREAAEQEKLKRQEGKIKFLEEENSSLREKAEKLNRPIKPNEIPKWVEDNFSGRLIFHEKAVALIENTSTAEVDMPLLCDSLEFLAKEYRDQMIGAISEEERNTLCSKRYDRPFTVTPLTEMAINKYPLEYKIKYYEDEKGKKRESSLNIHLKSGTGTENLIRIYFLYDKEKQLIVIGSLPKHLKTLKKG